MMKNTRGIRRLLITLGIGMLLAAGCFGAAGAEEARNIAAQCRYRIPRKSSKNTWVLCDGRYSEYWESVKTRNPWLEVTLPEGETCSGVQIKWEQLNTQWSVEVEQDGKWVKAGEATGAYLTTWTPLPGVTKFRVSSSFSRWDCMKILEIEVYSAGEIPATVQMWEPTVEKADLLLVVAHPDDEYVFLGALIPFYGAENGKNVLVCYITKSRYGRQAEMLDSLWAAGQRTYPLPGIFNDRYTRDLETAYKKVGKKKAQEYMIEVFRHYKPDVVVTHDIHGEYGHGMHKLCADIVINALNESGDSKVCRKSAKEYGTWEVPKCYIHLYGREKDQVKFDWKGTPLNAFGGKSAWQVADEAFRCYVSQYTTTTYEVYTDGPYDSQVFGLYRSLVGEDLEHNDLFENIPGKSIWMVDSEEE